MAQKKSPAKKTASKTPSALKKPKAKVQTSPQVPTQRAAKPSPAKAKPVKAELVDDNAPAFEQPRPEGQEELFANSEIDSSEIDSAETGSKLPTLAPAGGERGLTTTDPVALYLREVRKYPLLTKEQEAELARKYFETKDPAAAQALVTSNLRFVVKVAAEYSRFGARLIDLIQEGNMGLMHAVREFNPYRGVRLITYAVWWIRGYIQEYLMKQYSLVKIGTTQNQKRLFYRLQKEKEALDALGETPDMAVIGERLGIPKEEVEEMNQRIRGRDVSLNQPVDEESGSSLMDFQRAQDLSPDELLGNEEELSILREKIEQLRPQLNERENILLEERLLSDDPLTLQEIGEKYGITREAVRQAESRLLKKIKDLLTEGDKPIR